MNARALLPALLAATALAGCSDPYATTPAPTSSAPVPATTPQRSREQINRQQQTTDRQREREQAAMDERPLLDHLPLAVGDVEISIYGLAEDERRTVLQIVAPDRATGQQTFDAALRAYGDSGGAYETEYVTR